MLLKSKEASVSKSLDEIIVKAVKSFDKLSVVLNCFKKKTKHI